MNDSPNILDAQRLFGKPDYLLRVIAADLAAFQQLYDTSSPPCPACRNSPRPS